MTTTFILKTCQDGVDQGEFKEISFDESSDEDETFYIYKTSQYWVYRLIPAETGDIQYQVRINHTKQDRSGRYWWFTEDEHEDKDAELNSPDGYTIKYGVFNFCAGDTVPILFDICDRYGKEPPKGYYS